MPSDLLAFADGLSGAAPLPAGVREVRQYVGFGVRDQAFAVMVDSCREVVRPLSITRVPEAPAAVCGVINLRGRIVPVVDMSLCLGMGKGLVTGKSRLMVVDIAGRHFGLLVDRVVGILKLSSGDLAAPGGELHHPAVVGVAGVGAAAIHILDVERLVLGRPATSAGVVPASLAGSTSDKE